MRRPYSKWLNRAMIKKLTLLLAILSLTSCELSTEDDLLTPYNSSSEFVQQVVETAAMVDELVMGTGAVSPSSDNQCDSRPYSACSLGVRTKTFNGCKQGRSFTDGTAQLIWKDSSGATLNSCVLSGAGDKMAFTVNKNVDVQGGSSSSVKSNGTTSYSLVANSLGSTPTFLLNGTGVTKTISDRYKVSVQVSNQVIVNGLGRLSRTMNSGTFLFSDLLNNETCQLSPNSLIWQDANCPCPTSGKIVGQCVTDSSETKSFFIQFTSCGRGNVAYGDYKGSNIYFPSCQ